jgi:hypothetical protein
MASYEWIEKPFLKVGYALVSKVGAPKQAKVA